jgi:pyruvate-formate lyase-activating enzyme
MVADSKDIRELFQVIAETNRKMQMRFKREHTYTLEKYEERLYKEVIYDTRQDQYAEEISVNVNTLKKAKLPTRIRNINQAAQEAQTIARWPIHPKRPYKVQNMHEPTTSKLNDPYHWVREMTAEDRALFKREEEEYFRLLMLKNDLLHKQLVRE